MFDALIVGGGPAGVSCALWLKQLGFKPALVEKRDRCGGLQLANPYTNTWIATSVNVHGADVANAMHENMLKHGVPLYLGQAARSASLAEDAITVTTSEDVDISAKYLVLAGGVTPKSGGFASRLGLIVGPGAQVASANVDGARVAILGGGDSAFENYHFLQQRGAASISVFARSLRARVDMLESVPVEQVYVGEYTVDADARAVNGVVFDQIFVLYGYEASAESRLGLDLMMRSDGHVWTDENCATSMPRVFAIGELARRGHPCCVTSMADGVTAAKAIQRALEQGRKARFEGVVKRVACLGKKVFS